MDIGISRIISRSIFFCAVAISIVASFCGELSAQVKVKKKNLSAQTTDIEKSALLALSGYLVWKDTTVREDMYVFRTAEGEVERTGRMRRVEFRPVDADHRQAVDQLIENCIDKMTGAGSYILFRGSDRITFSRDIEGDKSWIEVAITDDGYAVTVIEDLPVSGLSAGDQQAAATGVLPEVAIAQPALQQDSDVSISGMPRLRPPMVTYYVSGGAETGGDGTEEAPFRAIARAFEHAEELGAMKVRVILAFGQYDEEIVISRTTDIIGDENIPKIMRTVDAAGYGLKLENLEIRDAPGNAVLQEGGSLEMTNCRVVSTQRSSGDISSGRGVILSGGASAVITSCVFRSNEGQALLLTGADTRATCSDLRALYNQVHPDAAENASENDDVSGTGCIEVSEGAKLQMEEFDLSGNEFIGVLLRNGASAHLRYGRIDGTEGFGNSGGFNLTVLYDCRIEMRHLVTSNAACGLHMFDSTMRVMDIELINNSIGISFQEAPEGYDPYSCLYAFPNNIRMQDNGINFDGMALSVPDVSGTTGNGDEGDAEPYCPEVPWE
jgi:hypothetical protein